MTEKIIDWIINDFGPFLWIAIIILHIFFRYILPRITEKLKTIAYKQIDEMNHLKRLKEKMHENEEF